MNIEKQKVLIVDDIDSNILLLKKALKNLDVEIVEANSGKVALQLVENFKFDLILLDIQMPEMDGFEVFEALQENENTQSIKVIFVTAAFTDEISRIKGYQYGAVDYIQKPIDNLTLLARVSVFLKLTAHEEQLIYKNQILKEEIEERRKTENALRESERQLNLAAIIFNEGAEAALITDHQCKIINVNASFTKITGYSLDDVIGKYPSILKSDRHDNEFYQAMWYSIITTGKWHGEIWNRRKNGSVYPEWETITKVTDKTGEVVNFIATFIDISQHIQQQDRIHYLAHFDSLTSLPNRPFFLEQIKKEIARSKRNQRAVAVLLLDLDRFKRINDTFGHPIGDELLVQYASRLLACMRKEDTIARLSGDELIILVADLDNDKEKAVQQVVTIADKIFQALSTSFQVEGYDLLVSVSIGVSLSYNGIGNADTLIKQADTAMYKAKDEGGNTFRFFEVEMEDAAVHRMKIEYELRSAISKNELFVYFQPQIDVSTNKIIGAESLLRWTSATLGFVSPADFIPVAEETGLIFEIGNWVLETVCKQIKVFESEGQFETLQCIAVNISARQFNESNFLKIVSGFIEKTGIDPKHLELELTESTLVTDVQALINKLHALKNMGIRISIDDFGTGYSSLAYLQKFPINVLKIDQSFIRGLSTDFGDETIVKTIIAMAKTFKLHVIAEGVETTDQLNYLKQEGCDAYQGYLCSPAIEVDAFKSILKNECPC
ncbi:MAG: EAL domain-containing protein [Methylomarinum sp.]|nr:EAL domain-containing protein [Methylomarinum sp.]